MYTPREHAGFGDRMGNAMRDLRQLQIEFTALGEIYIAQAEGGESAEFVDVGPATADELRQGMAVGGSFLNWLTGLAQTTQEDRRPVTTAFIQAP